MKIRLEWQQDGESRTATINELIHHAATEKPMAGDPWVYGGSYIEDGYFIAESSGDLIAIFLSNAAMINFSGKDNRSDEVWLPHPTRIPEVGTPVTVTLSPFPSTK